MLWRGALARNWNYSSKHCWVETAFGSLHLFLFILSCASSLRSFFPRWKIDLSWSQLLYLFCVCIIIMAFWNVEHFSQRNHASTKSQLGKKFNNDDDYNTAAAAANDDDDDDLSKHRIFHCWMSGCCCCCFLSFSLRLLLNSGSLDDQISVKDQPLGTCKSTYTRMHTHRIAQIIPEEKRKFFKALFTIIVCMA